MQLFLSGPAKPASWSHLDLDGQPRPFTSTPKSRNCPGGLTVASGPNRICLRAGAGNKRV
jgi:hypothetical protein